MTDATCGPKPENPEQAIRDLILPGLKDPDSARFSFEPLVQGYYKEPGLGKPRVACWHMKAWVNAKNALGGYTGREPYWFSFKDGKIVTVVKPWERPTFEWGAP
jgi:hypothetical protein